MTDSVSTRNPATAAQLGTYPESTPAQVEQILDRAVETQQSWAALGIDRRARLLRTIAERIRSEREQLAMLAVQEMGKPLTEALSEVDKCASVCDYYGEHGPAMLADQIVEAGHARSWSSYQPLGVVLAVMPWNFPHWQVWRCLAPALLAGNVVVLKHSPNVTGCAMAAADVVAAAGLPAAAVQVLVLTDAHVPDVVERLVADDRIAAVTVTGSERAGASVAGAAGAAIKKSVLELGGSDPFVVLADANMDSVIPAAVSARFLNAGQSCLSAKRFLIHESLAGEFGQRLTVEVEKLVVGDPTDTATQIGPLARPDLAQTLSDAVSASIAAGARCLTGGSLESGSWFPPTVLTEVTEQMPVMVEETFGPVAVVTSFDTDEAAISLANATRYGLAASVWSADTERALRIGSRIHSGALFVNSVVASDPRLPFGGIKRSGYGRELGVAGAREFTNLRTIVID